MNCLRVTLDAASKTPSLLLLSFVAATWTGICVLLYTIIYFAAPIPRPPQPSEKTYSYIDSNGKISENNQLPCWYDKYMAEKEALRLKGDTTQTPTIEPPSLLLSVVIPAFNEEKRLGAMLTEAVAFLEKEFPPSSQPSANGRTTRSSAQKSPTKLTPNGTAHSPPPSTNNTTPLSGYEILIISDGSTDTTISTALSFASTSSPSPSTIRVISLSKNRGKGGAVTHGLRHVRGAYAIFADADGASRFSDLSSLLTSCRSAQSSDPLHLNRGIAVGSRAHLVASEAVVKRSFLRNLLMHGFHLFLRVMTPPKTRKIRDTQCGFKIFSKEALGDVVPYMHCEGWIFDVEMLMLAEAAGCEVREVPVGWREVGGSKLNVVRDSLGMAWGLGVLRGAWATGVYRRG